MLDLWGESINRLYLLHCLMLSCRHLCKRNNVVTVVARLQKKMNLKLPHCHHSHWKELEKKLKMLFLFFFYDEK